MVDKQKRNLLKVVGRNYPHSHLRDLMYKEVMKGFSGWVLNTGKAINISDYSSDSREIGIALETAKKLDIGPLIIAPLKFRDRIFGILSAVRHVGSPSFTQEDLDLACSLANQAAIAIENSFKIKEIESIIEREKIAASISAHEFRAPLDMISSGVELIKRITIPKEGYENNLNNIYKNINETIDLMSFIILQGTFTDPDWEPVRKKINVFDIVESVVNILQPHAKSKRKTIVAEDNLKDIGFKYLDSESIKQVLYNVIINAVKYSKPNSSIRVLRGFKTINYSDCIEIHNDGYGIAKKDVKSIFDLSFRGKISKRYSTGYGKGLYIAKRIMKAQDGDLVVINRKNPTIFGLYFG